VWNASGVEVPFYRGWERGSGGGEGWLNGRSIGGDGEWRLSPLKLVKALVEGGQLLRYNGGRKGSRIRRRGAAMAAWVQWRNGAIPATVAALLQTEVGDEAGAVGFLG
jgi:hypothetical protein